MVFDNSKVTECMFCGGHSRLKYKGVFHPFKSDHGPFNINVCSDCGSSQTSPMPSRDSLSALYDSYHDGLPELHRTLTKDDPQIAVYQLCLNRIAKFSKIKANDNFTWIDIGAGGGEFSALMATSFPQ